MSEVSENLRRVRASLPARGVTLVAVSKFHPAEAVREAYDAGQRVFGESRVAELAAKAALLPDDITWHFIGHLQSNKVKTVVSVADVIESIDSEVLLRRVDRAAAMAGRRLKVLLQVHVAREETKFGFTPDELLEVMTPELLGSLTSVTVAGVMGMASNTDDEERVRADFAAIRRVFDRLREGVMAGNSDFTVISMGMSGDRDAAIAEGSNTVRIGTDIFGSRLY